jgi:hypothetical protein
LLPAAGVQGVVGATAGGVPPGPGGVEVSPGVDEVGVVGLLGFVPGVGAVEVVGGIVPGV